MHRLPVLALLLVTPAAFGQAESVEDFLARRDAWERMAGDGTPVRLEGRVSTANGGQIRLRNFPLAVKPADGRDFDHVHPATRRVEVTGVLRSGRSALYVEASNVRRLPDDAAWYGQRVGELDRDDPAAWAALADWAARRASFYRDEQLAALAAQARVNGFEREWNALPADGAAGERRDAAFALLDSAAGRGVPAGAVGEKAHRVLRGWWDAARDDPDADLAPLLDALRTRLPDAGRPADEPLPDDPSQDGPAAAYDADPVAAYADADPEARRRLHRRFFAAVARESVERTAAPDGRDGFAVAARLEALLPERPDLADAARKRELAWRLARVGTATQSEVTELAGLFDARGEPARAAEARTTWLTAREAALRDEGPGGLLRAAELYLSVAEDRPNAVRLLREAERAAPDSPAVADAMRTSGMKRVDDRWVTPGEAAAMPVDPLARAVRAGRVLPGMTAAQVRAALGEPQSVTRAASAAHVGEAWVYGEGGRGIVVHLLRYSRAPTGDAKVVAVGRVR